jgi:hypothetical protein
MPPIVIISVGGAIGMPQPPPGPNMPIELIPTVPPNRLNDHGLDDLLTLNLYFNLSVDVHLVKQDQLVTPAIGMQNSIFLHGAGDGMHQESGKRKMLPGRFDLPQAPPSFGDVDLDESMDDVSYADRLRGHADRPFGPAETGVSRTTRHRLRPRHDCSFACHYVTINPACK